ncbi:MAG: porin [bacterium]
MKGSKQILCILIAIAGFSNVHAQLSDPPLQIFGYFQNSFTHQTLSEDDPEQNSFNMQQLNLFFQKKLGKNWRAFVNFEFINSFSSSRQWGAANLEEAWAAYSKNEKFNLKLGLLLPIFNNLNEFKNRTPLLPYVIRPLAYETSFQEFLPVEDFAPARAFVQAYGFLATKKFKFDYAAFLGNSPNIAAQNPLEPDERAQTGIDTTNSFTVGGRLGLRYNDDFKVGFSTTQDKTNIFANIQDDLFLPSSQFGNVTRRRYGGDLSFNLKKISFESEFILVRHDEDFEQADLDRDFYYLTAGYRINEELFIYASFWHARLDYTIAAILDDQVSVIVVKGDVDVPNIGFAYNLNDRITLKGHFAKVDEFEQVPTLQIYESDKFYHLNAAISIFF